VILSGYGEKLPVMAAKSDPVQTAGQSAGPVRVPAGEDIRGDIPRAAVQVVNPPPFVKGQIRPWRPRTGFPHFG